MMSINPVGSADTSSLGTAMPAPTSCNCTAVEYVGKAGADSTTGWQNNRIFFVLWRVTLLRAVVRGAVANVPFKPLKVSGNSLRIQWENEVPTVKAWARLMDKGLKFVHAIWAWLIAVIVFFFVWAEFGDALLLLWSSSMLAGWGVWQHKKICHGMETWFGICICKFCFTTLVI